MICCGVGVTRSAAKPADFFLRQVLQDAAQSAAVLASIAFGRPNALVKGHSPLRPPCREEEKALRKRAIKISVRLNEQEHKHLKEQAMIAGRPIEPFIRALITGIKLRPRPPDELAELLRQMSGMAVNINQIAKVANASGFVRMEDIAHIKMMQGMLWQVVKAL